MKKTLIKFLFIIPIYIFTSFSFAQEPGVPSLIDENFKLLTADFEYETNFHFLITKRTGEKTDFWMRIDFPDLKLPNSKGNKIKGGYELIEYSLWCDKKIVEEKRRIQYDSYGQVQNILFHYPSYTNKIKIIEGTFFDVVRINVCE